MWERACSHINPMSGSGFGVRRQSLERCPQVRVADAISRGLNGRGSIIGQIHGVPDCAPLNGRRLHLEQYSRETVELVKHLQLPLQTLLLVTQAGCPMAVGDNQQQTAFAPGSHVAMLASGGLQLAFEQTLQMTQALSVAENGFQRLGFA